MSPTSIRVHDQGAVRTITLARPARRNALTRSMIDELTVALRDANASSVRVLVLRGEGEAFCAGLDLTELQAMAAMTPEQHRVEAERIAALLRALWDVEAPTIALVQGAAVAGGMGLATLCDFTLATAEARFGYTEARIGFVPALVSAYLALQVGDKVARGLLLRAQLLAAQEAHGLGLVSEVVDDLEARGEELCAELLRNSPESLRATKRLLRAQHAPWLDAALALAMEANAESRQTADFREGVASFLEKRKPVWR